MDANWKSGQILRFLGYIGKGSMTNRESVEKTKLWRSVNPIKITES